MSYKEDFSTAKPKADIVFNKCIVEYLQERLLKPNQSDAASIDELKNHFQCHYTQITTMVKNMKQSGLLSIQYVNRIIKAVTLSSHLRITHKQFKRQQDEKQMIAAVQRMKIHFA